MTLLEQMQEIETAKNNIKHSLELKGKNPNDDIRTYSAIINSMDGDVPSAMKTKIIIQDEEPDETIPYEGIWIKSNTFTYENVYAINKRDEIQPNGVNILIPNIKSKKVYKTILLDSDIVGGCYTNFVEILLTDENNDILWEIPIYYGNDTLDEWVDITPSDIRWVGLHIDYVAQTVEEISGSYDINTLNCYSNRLGVNLTNDGLVTAYYGDNDYDYIGNENLQLMVEQPQVYVKVENVILNTDNKTIRSADYYIADGKLDGYELHAAFVVDGLKYKNIYLNAFQGVVKNNKVCSYRCNSIPTRNISCPNFRTYAQNRGQFWRQWTFLGQQLELLLCLFEYKTFNFTQALARGRTSSNMQAVGMVQDVNLNDVGTGFQAYDKTIDGSFMYRYRENPYGNGSIFLDGIHHTSSTYLLTNSHFVSNTSASIYKKVILGYGPGTISSNCTFSKFYYVQIYPYLFIPYVDNSTSSMLSGARADNESTGNVGAVFSWNSPTGIVGNLYSFGCYSGQDYTGGNYNYVGLMCYPESQIDFDDVS